jgi:hypothetical protein
MTIAKVTWNKAHICSIRTIRNFLQPQALLLEDREKLESLVMRVKGAGDAR